MSEVPLYGAPLIHPLAAFAEVEPHAGVIGDNSNGVNDFRTENESIQGWKMALTGLLVPTSLDSGLQNW